MNFTAYIVRIVHEDEDMATEYRGVWPDLQSAEDAAAHVQNLVRCETYVEQMIVTNRWI